MYLVMIYSLQSINLSAVCKVIKFCLPVLLHIYNFFLKYCFPQSLGDNCSLVIEQTLIFYICLNYLPDSNHHHSYYHLFASDFQIYQYLYPTKMLVEIQKLQEGVNSIYGWVGSYVELRLNVKKKFYHDRFQEP